MCRVLLRYFLFSQRCLQNMVQVTVKTDEVEKSYKLEELLELQNKLMLMSSKGEHGREQVNRFTEVSDTINSYSVKLLNSERWQEVI